MPVRFAGSCESVPEGWQFRTESLELGPFTVTDLTQHTDPEYCEAATAPTHMQGEWVLADDTSGFGNSIAYPVTITVPEPSLTISLVCSVLLLWWWS